MVCFVSYHFKFSLLSLNHYDVMHLIFSFTLISKGYTKIVAALLSHGAGISLQYRRLLEDAAKCRNADILHLLFEHGAKSSSELVFATLEESLVNYVNSEAWIPVFQVRGKRALLGRRWASI